MKMEGNRENTETCFEKVKKVSHKSVTKPDYTFVIERFRNLKQAHDVETTSYQRRCDVTTVY